MPFRPFLTAHPKFCTHFFWFFSSSKSVYFDLIFLLQTLKLRWSINNEFRDFLYTLLYVSILVDEHLHVKVVDGPGSIIIVFSHIGRGNQWVCKANKLFQLLPGPHPDFNIYWIYLFLNRGYICFTLLWSLVMFGTSYEQFSSSGNLSVLSFIFFIHFVLNKIIFRIITLSYLLIDQNLGNKNIPT